MDVIGFGALNYDRLFKVDRIAEAGTEVNVIAESASPGGSAANTIYGLARLGVVCGFVGAVGNDAEGSEILKDFEEVGVDTSRIRILNEVRTGLVIGFVDRKGERALYVSPGANTKIRMKDVEISYFRGGKILHMSSFAREDQLQIQAELSKSLVGKVRISICPGALYARKGLDELRLLLESSDIIFLNEKEMEELTGKGYAEGSKDLVNLSQGIIAVTLGEEGCYVRNREGEYLVPTIAEKAVDTTGAGDSFATGFLYGVLSGKNPEECGKIGNLIASRCIQSFGARAGLPSLNEIQSSARLPR